MKITRNEENKKPKKITFEDLKPGDVFEYANCIYIKGEGEVYREFNTISLNSYVAMSFSSHTFVKFYPDADQKLGKGIDEV